MESVLALVIKLKCSNRSKILRKTYTLGLESGLVRKEGSRQQLVEVLVQSLSVFPMMIKDEICCSDNEEA